MKELNDLLRDMEDYIDWIKQVAGDESETLQDLPRENAQRLVKKVLGYNEPEEIISVDMIASPPVEADSTLKFLVVSTELRLSIDQGCLEHAGRCALAYGTNLFLYTNGPDIKVHNVDTEEGELELDAMMEFNLLQDDPTEIATAIWPISKKDCGKKVFITIPNYSS